MVCYNNIGCVVIQLSTLILPKSFKGAETSNTNFVVLLGFENLLFWGNNKNLELNFPLSSICWNFQNRHDLYNKHQIGLCPFVQICTSLQSKSKTTCIYKISNKTAKTTREETERKIGILITHIHHPSAHISQYRYEQQLHLCIRRHSTFASKSHFVVIFIANESCWIK